MHELANPAYLSRFPFSALPCVARIALPVVSEWCQWRHSCFALQLLCGKHPKCVQHLAGDASIQLTVDRYSHWMPTMGRNTADGMDEALG